MKPARALIPIGTATFGPDTARRVRTLERQLITLLSRWGYREIILPIFEYLDVLSVGLAPEVLEKCYKFADWTTGRILVLRPDITAQIARIVAMGMGGAELPLRLSYRTTVFRYEPEHAGRERERFQVGVELIGTDDASADAEVVMSLIELLKTIGLPDFKVSLGHVGFFQALLKKSGLSPSDQRNAAYAVAHKDLPLLENLLRQGRLPHKKIHVILEAAGRCGQEDVLEWGRGVAGRDRNLIRPIERLVAVYALLESAGLKDHILVDLGEFRGFDYYDGVVFDVFTSSLGQEIGGGGRYNHLLGRFGRDLPSTGFALDMDRVFASLDHTGLFPNEHAASILLMASQKQFGAAYRLAQRLRREDMPVIQEMVSVGTASRLKEHANDRLKNVGASTAILLGGGRSPESAILIRRTASQKNPRHVTVRVEDVPAILKEGAYARL
ncbi:MAG: ATP phosphoribosyltransferase regulatory subunit [Nitrospirales bacterium]|nr:ATP phosphoribosyltransferase regulatory subunit [Nitrospira sp.]MDR4501365.1 ATP phosphoribosyltransferase regulatory subunit [Nitrospirales bacterium]